MTFLAEIRKALAGIIGSVITWAFSALGDEQITTLEWVGLAAAIATGLGVYQIPNQMKKIARKRAAKKGG